MSEQPSPTILNMTMPPDVARQILFDAINQHLTPEMKISLVENAVSKLLQGSWATPSQLQQIFNQELQAAARKVFEVEFAKPVVKASIEAIVAEATAKALTDGEHREKLVEDCANALRKALTGDRY